MPVYWGLLGWSMITGVVFSNYKKEVIYDNKVQLRSTFFQALLCFGVLIFFMGLRSEVADTYAYIKMFNDLPTEISSIQEVLNTSREPGFVLFGILIKKFISNDYHVYLFIIALISGICTMIPLKKYSEYFGMSFFLFISGATFTWMLNGIRQYLVASILFLCIDLILEKKTALFIIITLILSTFHKSVLIYIPVYFLVQGEPWDKKTLLFLLVVLAILVFPSGFTEILSESLMGTDYENITQQFATDDGTNIIRVLINAVPIILAFWKRDEIKKITTPVINLSINMSIVSTGLYLVSTVTSGVLIGRLPIYFSLYNLILLPWIVFNVFEKKECRLVCFIMIILYIAYFYYQMCISWNGLGYISNILNLNV